MPNDRAASVLEIPCDSQVIKVDANIDIQVRQPSLKMSPKKMEAINSHRRLEIINKSSKKIDLSNYFE